MNDQIFQRVFKNDSFYWTNEFLENTLINDSVLLHVKCYWTILMNKHFYWKII